MPCFCDKNKPGIKLSFHRLKANAALVATYRTLSNSLGLLGLNIAEPKANNKFAPNAFNSKSAP